MTDAAAAEAEPKADAALAAALFAVDPLGLGGVVVRAMPGPARDAWLAVLRERLPAETAIRRLPLNTTEDRLLGGLDLTATLAAGRPVAERGFLATADGGIVLAAMAERMAARTASHLASALDWQEVRVERDGLASVNAARIGVVAYDEGIEPDERVPAALADRLAFHVVLDESSVADGLFSANDVENAREILPEVEAGDGALAALCATALALGVHSARAPLLALRAARAAAALDGRTEVSQDDAALAARLVLAPRATRLPVEPDQPDDNDQETPEPPESDDDSPENRQGDALDDVVLAAAQAAIPKGLLDQLKLGAAMRSRQTPGGRAGQLKHAVRRGRPIGTKPGDPRSGARLSLIDTLRAAAPWQRIRAQPDAASGARIYVRRDDLRVTRVKQHTETTSIFVVDASGSAALNRLAEAKGAVELLLADCYIRRDEVALIAFRGATAEVLLPPTRSLARARRYLAGLPGGGGTPLATGLTLAWTLIDAAHRKGRTPTVVLLTDGRANIAQDGSPGRPRAEDDAIAAAKLIRATRAAGLLIDTAPRPYPFAARVASEMGATYFPLPYADAEALSNVVRQATAPSSRHG